MDEIPKPIHVAIGLVVRHFLIIAIAFGIKHQLWDNKTFSSDDIALVALYLSGALFVLISGFYTRMKAWAKLKIALRTPVILNANRQVNHVVDNLTTTQILSGKV